MIFVIMFVVSWASIFILYSMDKRLSVVENAVICLIIFVIGLNISWITTEEYNLIELTKNGLSYTAYLLYRTIALPLIYVIFLNTVVKLGRTVASLLSACLVIVIILSINGLMLYYDTLIYKQWNLFYDTVQIILLQAASYGVLKILRKSVDRGVNLS